MLDMAMSQFSYGTLTSYRMRGELLPVDGGFELEGQLTKDSGAIERSNRPSAHRLLEGFGSGFNARSAGGTLVRWEGYSPDHAGTGAGNHDLAVSFSQSIVLPSIRRQRPHRLQTKLSSTSSCPRVPRERARAMPAIAF